MIAREGLREITISALVLGLFATGAAWLYWPLGIPFAVLFIWVLCFFRDPPRNYSFQQGQLCSPADGTVTEICELDHHDAIGGPAIRIGIFLSLFNVHINRVPCSGTIRSLAYRAGEFLDARHPESGKRNESNTILIDPDSPLPGPVEVRQVAGLVARRIICHAKIGDHYSIGARFGLIKFGSRTELTIPKLAGTKILISLGSKVRAGKTLMAEQPCQPVDDQGAKNAESAHQNDPVDVGSTTA